MNVLGSARSMGIGIGTGWSWGMLSQLENKIRPVCWESHIKWENRIGPKSCGAAVWSCWHTAQRSQAQGSARMGMCGFHCCFLQGKGSPLPRPLSCGASYLQNFCASHGWLLPLPTPWISRAFPDTEMIETASSAALEGGPGVPYCILGIWNSF